MRALLAAIVALAAVPAAQEFRRESLERGERAVVERILTRAMQGQRTRDAGVRWTPYFLKSADRRTYVPFTLTLDDAGERFASAAVSIGVGARELLNARFGGFGLRLIQRNAFGTDLRPAGSGARFLRSALMLAPGSYEVFIVLRERRGHDPGTAVLTDSVVVPDFTRKGLLLSSVLVIDRLEPLEDSRTIAGASRPFVPGAAEAVPRDGTRFSRDETLTVAFQVYNAATFVDGKPDVQVDYVVYREGEEKPVGATAPQTYDVDSLPEEFSAKAGHQLTPVQALPLKQFAPGGYRLAIEVRDFLGEAHATAEVRFTVE